MLRGGQQGPTKMGINITKIGSKIKLSSEETRWQVPSSPKDNVPSRKKYLWRSILILLLLLLFSYSVISDSFATPWTVAWPGSSVHGIS